MRKFFLFIIFSSYVFAGSNICTLNYGYLIESSNGVGKKYQICILPDNRQCALSAMQKGFCPVHGIKIIGYDNDAQIYCAINGGKVIAEKNAICSLPNGNKLSAESYYYQK